MCADQVKEIILNQIVNVGFFAIMCDEARCYREEQLSICVRYVVDLQVYERFIGFVNVSSGQDANNILAAITDFFKTQTIDISTLKIIAQSFDGASVMSGRLNGVQAKIKELYPSAIYTHCMAHRLNLVVVDMCKNIKV
ncbi:zinc finger protein 862-like [Aphis gossypii]|uniref:zinc finger protein 862-like n=1 Tax=Aphis gossypii TaxID=80765 RepID=UPI002158D2D4|nr:zinc finger protein 862-like [Aphis gossypii]